MQPIIDLTSFFAASIQGPIEPVQSIMNIKSSDLYIKFFKGLILFKSELIRDIYPIRSVQSVGFSNFFFR